MTRYFLLLALLVIGLSATAQNNMDEVVYLKDGTAMRGLIIEFVPGVSISIQDANRELHTYTMAEVAKIRREPKAKVPPLKKAPFYAALEVGLTDYPTPRNHPITKNWALFSANFVAGIKVGKLVATGLGAGVDVSSPSLIYGSFYWNLRVAFTKKRVAPYLDINAGYIGINVKYQTYHSGLTGHDDGGMVNPSIGIKVALGKKVNWTASLGYKAIFFPGTQLNNYYAGKQYSTNGHALTLRTGVFF